MYQHHHCQTQDYTDEMTTRDDLSPPEAAYHKLSSLVSRNAVVVLSVSGCCMCHVVKRLLLGLGVAPTIVELDRAEDIFMNPEQQQEVVVPAVFVGGRFLGGVETVLAYHINGWLVPLLKYAGALWL